MQSQRAAGKRSRWIAALAVLASAAVGTGYLFVHGKAAAEIVRPEQQPETTNSSGTVAVKVVSPRPGGIDRLCTQPGSVEPYEAADLYAKVSGFLVEQNVDIGYPVRAGDVLARISVPEYEKQVK